MGFDFIVTKKNPNDDILLRPIQVKGLYPLSVGAFPDDQGGGQDAHAAGFTRQHPELRPRF